MNVVDSSAWLSWVADDGNADRFAPAIEDTEPLLVSSITLIPTLGFGILRCSTSPIPGVVPYCIYAVISLEGEGVL